MAPPFKQAEFDILYGHGISREGGLIDMGVEHGFVRKSGAWYTYEGDQLGQGKENARTFLKDNPDLANEIEKKIKEKLGVGPRVDAARRGLGRACRLLIVGPSEPETAQDRLARAAAALAEAGVLPGCGPTARPGRLGTRERRRTSRRSELGRSVSSASSSGWTAEIRMGLGRHGGAARLGASAGRHRDARP